MAIHFGNNLQNKTPTNTQTDLDTVGGHTTTSGEVQSAPETPQNEASPTTPTTPAPTAPGHQTPSSYLMTGEAQQTQVNQVKMMQEMRAKLRGGAREFWLNPGEFAKLYFLDGKLLSDNVFDTPMIAVHMLQIGGDWVKFVCNKHTEGQCVVCDSNADGSQPNTMQVFTVINVIPYTIKNGPRRGQVMPARLQLFAATLKVRDKLMKRAQNHGGALAGSLYQFSRGSKQDPRTGEDIEYLQDVPMQSVLAKYPKLGSKRTAKNEWEAAPTTVYDYAKVYPVLTNAEIAALRPDLASLAGFTSYQSMQGASGPASGFGADPTGEMDDEVPF